MIAVVQHGGMASLPSPPDPGLPLFAYGLLQPGELAHSLLQPFLASSDPATAPGVLLVRDGLPLFDVRASNSVSGHLLFFKDHSAWKVVTDFEPKEQYKWGIVEASGDKTQHVRANVLIGRRPDAGVPDEHFTRWSARLDPVFVEGLHAVHQLVLDTAPDGVAAQPDRPELWQQFFRLQATYLLLWSIVERYTALRFGPSVDPTTRIKNLDGDPAFNRAVIAAGVQPDEVVDARDPARRIRLGPDGDGAAKYFYQIRSNLSHRGTSAFKDGVLVHKAVVGLHDAMRSLLAEQLPDLKEAWSRQDPDGGWTRDSLDL
jgi:hypothetical protein